MENLKVKDRIALVTGFGKDVGESVAMELSRNGAKVIVSDFDENKVNCVVNEINKMGNEAIGIVVDISKKNQVEDMFKKIISEFGRIDILVYCAEIALDNGILDILENELDSMIDINLKGTFLCCQEAVRHMKAQKFGRIINISSRDWLGWPNRTSFSATKGGVISLTRALALELIKDGVTVNCIAPGEIYNSQNESFSEERIRELLVEQPTQTIGKAEDIAYGVLYFADNEASFITGQVIYICGGNSLLSSLSV